jgi:hypothetical protein
MAFAVHSMESWLPVIFRFTPFKVHLASVENWAWIMLIVHYKKTIYYLYHAYRDFCGEAMAYKQLVDDARQLLWLTGEERSPVWC